ncbi:hypothetical protein CDAR_104811 [Caerostris darwini]|uniref:Uncharacterized protein n=1 Tax=Caerostris darwini TaxID=1538125 RepID=A0AAV4W2E9_9ARAC|nr:hypothetical protein CDAR_104811 [Caerostris darwini]
MTWHNPDHTSHKRPPQPDTHHLTLEQRHWLSVKGGGRHHPEKWLLRQKELDRMKRALILSPLKEMGVCITRELKESSAWISSF